MSAKRRTKECLRLFNSPRILLDGFSLFSFMTYYLLSIKADAIALEGYNNPHFDPLPLTAHPTCARYASSKFKNYSIYSKDRAGPVL